VKSTAHIFGLFGDQKHSDLVNKIWFIHESRYVTASKLDWAVVLLRVMRDEIKNSAYQREIAKVCNGLPVPGRY